MRVKKIFPLLFSLLLCAAVFSGCSSNSTQNKQNEVNGAFAEAVEKFKNTTHAHGTRAMEASDSSMFNLDFRELFGDEVLSVKWSWDANLDVRENKDGNVIDYRSPQLVSTTLATDSSGTISEIKTYFPDDGYSYVNTGSRKTKSKQTSEFVSIYRDFPYLDVAYLEEITLDTDNNKKTFNFKVASPQRDLLTNFYPLDDFVNKINAIKLVDFGGTLTTDDKSDQVLLTINIEYKNIKTNETLKYSQSVNRSNSTHKLEFPNDLDSYTSSEK